MSSKSMTKPSIASRIQQHATAFDFCLQSGDFASAKLKAMQMNMDLEPAKQVKIGHGIDSGSVRKDARSEDDLKGARLLDENCQQCQDSINICDIHPPKELIHAKDKNNRTTIEMEWLTRYILLVENRIREVGYAKGWWQE